LTVALLRKGKFGHHTGPYLEGGGPGDVAHPGQKSQKNLFALFLGKAKYFITILTKSNYGAAKLLFYHNIRFFLQKFTQNVHFVGMSFSF
jgi:hypothetical protein